MKYRFICKVLHTHHTFFSERTGLSIEPHTGDPLSSIVVAKGGLSRLPSQPVQQGGLAFVVVPDDEQTEGGVPNSTAVWLVSVN